MNKTLSECLSLTIDRRGVTPKKLGSDWSDKGYRVLSANNVKTTGLQNINEIRCVDEETYKRWMKEEIEKGDIILTSEAPAGEVLFWDSDEKIVAGQRVYILRTREDVDALFLKYYIQSEKGQAEIKNKCSGSTVFGISAKTFDSIEIVLPESIEEQKKISTLLYNIDKKIENNNKINAELESMAKTIYDYWFLQFEFPNEDGKPYKSSGGKMVWNEELKREIPEGWGVKVIEDFCRIFTGKKDVNQALEAGEYKFFSCSPDYKYSNEMLHSGKAILVSGNGSYTGRTIFVNDAFDLYQRTYACVSSTDKDILEYIYYSMLRVFTQKVGGGTHGSAIPYIVFDDIAKEPILYNADIVEKYQNIVIPLQEKIIKNQRENEELSSLRDFLLPMLMNGQVGFK